MATLRQRHAPRDERLAWLALRTRWLLRRLTPLERALVRALPALLVGRFRRPGFDREPPGLLRPPKRRRWGKLFEKLGWIAPAGTTGARPLIASVHLAPAGADVFELYVAPVADLGADQPRLKARLDALEALLQRKTPRLRLVREAPTRPEVWAYAGLVCGEFPGLSSFHSKPDAPRPDWALGPPTPVDVAGLAERAPTPLARALALLVSAGQGHPLAELPRPAPIDGSPEAFLAAWTQAPVAHECVAAVRLPDLGPEQVLATARSLRRACCRAYRALPVELRRRLHPQLRGELFANRVPAALASAFLQPAKAPRLDVVHGAQGAAVLLGELVLARGRNEGEAVLRAAGEAPWLPVSADLQRLARRHQTERRQHLVVVGAHGEHRLVTVGGGRRARLDYLSTAATLQWVAVRHFRGEAVELTSDRASSGGTVALLARVLEAPQDGRALAVELDERLCVVDARGVRWPTAEHFLRRPRLVHLVSEMPGPRRALFALPTARLPTVHVVAEARGDWAQVLFRDADGWLLRRTVPLEELEHELLESQEVLEHQTPSVRLCVSATPQATALVGRRFTETAADVRFAAVFEGPRRVWALSGGERFGLGGLPWHAAGELVLSHWPLGTHGRLALPSVTLPTPAPGRSPLWALAVRALVLRQIACRVRGASQFLDAA